MKDAATEDAFHHLLAAMCLTLEQQEEFWQLIKGDTMSSYKFEVWARIEGTVYEQNNPHEAYHEFDKALRSAMSTYWNSGIYSNFALSSPSTLIRAYNTETNMNVDPGEINTHPCPTCKGE